MMHLSMLVVAIFTLQHTCLAYNAIDDVDEDLTARLSPENDYLTRSSQPESRLIPIITFNPFNKHQNQNSLAVNAATQQQFDQLKKELQTLQTAYNKIKPEAPNIVKLYKNLQALNTRLKVQGINIKKVVDNAGKLKASLPRCPASAAPGAKVLGNYCYWVNTTKKNLQNAGLDCISKGGILAEPLPNFSTSLYLALKKAFPTQFTTIGSNGLWIGVDNELERPFGVPIINDVDYYVYMSTNTRILGLSIVAPTSGTYTGIRLVGDGAIWTPTVAVIEGQTIEYAYICQSSTLPI